ncbi:MAG: family 43 glycosylhydrolase [Akkermansiaceae bacterium]|nr:family 43 glycosylhydrolase [Verrucomicrobiales bacterium]
MLFVGFVGALAGGMPVPAAQPVPPPIQITNAPVPLFDDPVWHGASDPFVIWNPVKELWFMYYTQRRATLTNAQGVDWVHGSAIGIAASRDGADWKYLGTCLGDRDLSEPLKAEGHGVSPGITWWAPCFLEVAGTFHMFVTRVDGIYTNWTGKRNIVHFSSTNGLDWKFVAPCKLSSDRVIDPTVYQVQDTWYMVYKDEAAGSRTFRSESRDLIEWTNPVPVTREGSQEAPFVFRWENSWWLIVDAIPNRGLRLYQSDTGIDQWRYVSTVLAGDDGTRPMDRGAGHHPGILLQRGRDGREQCLVVYFTHQRQRTVLQLAELELTADGKVTCNRNKYSKGSPPSE